MIQKLPKLPIRITLLLWMVLTITAWNLVRLVTSIGWRVTLETYAPWPGPFYIGLTGAIWTLMGLFLFWSFVVGASWSRIGLLICGFVYSIWFWVDRLFIQPQVRANWTFGLLVTIILLGFTSAVVLDTHNQIYFVKRDL
jgi:hypothetical protein